MLGEAKALLNALDYYVYRTTENHIPRFRLEELATLFKDELIMIDTENSKEYFEEDCEMSDMEMNYFEIEEGIAQRQMQIEEIESQIAALQ